MRIPQRLFLLQPSPVRPAAAGCLIGLALALGASGLGGCHHDGKFSNVSGNQRVEGGVATLDARGSSVDSEVSLHSHVAVEGNGGSGGSIAVTSSGGTVDISSADIDPLTFDVAGTIAGLDLTGNGLVVQPGETREIQGGVSVENALPIKFLHVLPGGTLLLDDNTSITITGDALIEGTVRSNPDTGVIRQDGHDFILNAGGKVVVTGSIITSGENAQRLPVTTGPGISNPQNVQTLGGKGGDLNITSTGLIMVTDTGTLFSEGGGNDSQDSSTGAAGAGGTISLTPGGDLFFAGQATARAGNSFTNNINPGPSGGAIAFTATGNVLMRRIASINATGGRNTGTTGGAGGTVDATAVGTFTLTGVAVDVSGGRVLFKNGSAGNGGTVAFTSGSTLTLAPAAAKTPNPMIRADGGDVTETSEGAGGAGGTVTLTGTSIDVQQGVVDVTQRVAIQAQGGDSQGTADVGGGGGQLQLKSMTVNFDGTGDLRGGNNFGGQAGALGTLCTSSTPPLNAFTNPQDLGNITGFDLTLTTCL
jgi:hypothetical protein